jgi:hypothetical protein
MLIIGCDFHTRYQQIAMAREETGELLVERRLDESALTSPNNSCYSPDSLCPAPRFCFGSPDCYLSTPSSLQLSAFE